MIEVKNIYCGYDNKEIIKNLSFKVNNGENLCIVGPNGCGKSTLLKSIANIIEYRGNVKIDDKEVNNFSRVDLAKKVAKQNNNYTGEIKVLGKTNIGVAPERYVPDISKIIKELGVKENYTLEAAIKRTIEYYKGL